MKTFFRLKVVPFLVWIVYQIWRSTWRVTLVEPPEKKRVFDGDAQPDETHPVVLAHWHSDAIPMLYLLKRYNCATLASTSKDGDLIDGVIQLLGAKASRGSSTRQGASGLKGLLRMAKAGHTLAIACDGPKGPYHKAKAGVFELSKLTRREIYPLAAATSNPWIIPRAWDKSYLPKPFSRFVVVWGEPLRPVSREDDPHDPKLAEELERRIAAAQQQALNIIAADRG